VTDTATPPTVATPPVVLVPNPYRSALDQALHRVEGDAVELAAALDVVQSALEGGAWRSPLADAFAATTAEKRNRLLQRCGDAGVATVRQARDGQPPVVEAGSWQTHWRNLR